MGKRGPKPIPDHVLAARGSDWWRKRNVSAPGPSLPAEAPDPPEGLPEEARAEWDRIVPVLAAAGAVTKADRSLLALYCRAWADYVELARAVTRSGHVEQSPRGGSRRTGASRALEAQGRALLQLARELRLTPASRGAFRQPREEKPDPLVEAGRRQRGETSAPRLPDARDGPGGMKYDAFEGPSGERQETPPPRLPSARDGPVAVQYDANEGPPGRRREGAPTPRLPSARDGPNAMDEMALPNLSQGPPRKRERNDHGSTGGSTDQGEQRAG